MKVEEEISIKWDYPNADNLDWNDAKNDMDNLLSRIRELEEGIRQLKQDLSSCNVVISHYSICQILEKLLEDK